MIDRAIPFLSIDLFVRLEIPFEELWNEADLLPIDGLTVRVCSVAHLIRMKPLAGRAEDLADIEALEALGDGT